MVQNKLAMIIAGGLILLVGMIATLIPKIPEALVTDAVVYVPPLFMILSAPVMDCWEYLIKHKKDVQKKNISNYDQIAIHLQLLLNPNFS